MGFSPAAASALERPLISELGAAPRNLRRIRMSIGYKRAASRLGRCIIWNLGKLQVFPAGSSPREPHEAGKTGTFGILSPCGDQSYLSSIW